LIDSRKKALRVKVAASTFPVKGLAFEGRSVIFNDLPFEQASDAERLKVSLQIAMALSPKLRVIRVREGARLDEKNLALVADMAETNDMQLWIERVQPGSGGSILIEDGSIAER
jgi:hypothetical protein